MQPTTNQLAVAMDKIDGLVMQWEQGYITHHEMTAGVVAVVIEYRKQHYSRRDDLGDNQSPNERLTTTDPVLEKRKD